MTACKQCNACQAIKPLSDFGPRRGACKHCRVRREVERQRTKRGTRRGDAKRRQGDIYERDLNESLLDVSSRKWRGPVQHGPMVPALGRAA